MVSVAFIMVMASVLAISCVFALWPRSGAAPTRAAPAAPAPDAPPTSLEGVLVARLCAGEITRRQYALGMQELAARDAERHPMVPPRAEGPG